MEFPWRPIIAAIGAPQGDGVYLKSVYSSGYGIGQCRVRGWLRVVERGFVFCNGCEFYQEF